MKTITPLLALALLALGSTGAQAQNAQSELGSQQRAHLLRTSSGKSGAVLYNRAQRRGNGGDKALGSAARRTLLMRHGGGRAIIPGPRYTRANAPKTFGSVQRTALVNRDPKLQRLKRTRTATTAAGRARVVMHRLRMRRR
jgi:hypothetical protein